ncbi:hypothetical protein N0V94_008118 [Neodidymelliopsis sp. IMI 364377]|nr:hypothetical protein N0V94_008118 [Neodidymelliopsis sp. IMI 364377]
MLVSESVRQTEPNFIKGNPEQGWCDTLDYSYRMRTGAEAREFFGLGRVFSMVYVEAASATAVVAPDDEAFTVVRYGSRSYTQIRRFVVVSVRRGFVHACAISTYKNQGTLKRGCDPSEHALVYNSGINPETCLFAGERERGLTKKPIEVAATATDTYLAKESRIRFGKIYSIEWNVKVKDLGLVVNNDLGTLVEHHNYENQKWDMAA